MFQDILKILDFTNAVGLLLVSQKDEEITESERKILYLAEQDYRADAVYFQKNENQKSIPQFFIYDNTNEKFNIDEQLDIHKRLWSSETVPLYFVFEKKEIKVFNAKKRLDFDTNGKESINPTDILQIAKKLEKEFENKKHIYSPYLFQNGSFWETDYFLKNYLKDSITKESPFEILITNLHELKNDLIDNNILPEIANRIVIFCILIKYLEEKKDENGNNVFTIGGNIFQKKWNVKDFSDLVKKGKFTELLNYLSEKFNGKIFERTGDEEDKIKNLSQNILNKVSNFVNANYKSKKQPLFLWRLYSFRYLPVELISRIYEEFITDTKGVVYTPPFLVDFLIDECMPLDKYHNFSTGKFKIIDPACGSGIFCVSAYQRLIDWHIINEYKKSGKNKLWNKDLKIETLKNILRENIFGVDLQPQAVQIAVFSLTIAMLEKLTPMQLWHDLDFEDKNNKNDKKFEDLKVKNIKPDNFFNYIKTCDKDFDLVIGNPPFNPDKSSNSDNFKNLQKEFGLKTSFKIPDDNLALLFLDKSIELIKDDGLQCLILPSSAILYNDGAMNYRNHFLKNYFVPQIVDFTHLRESLFKRKNKTKGEKSNKGRVAVSAFFAKKQKPDSQSQILHIISHRTANEENKLFFVFDTYDFHFVPQEVALTQKYIWKANLVGGGRLKWIVNRVSQLKNTIDLFVNKTENVRYLTGNYKFDTDSYGVIIKRLVKKGSIQINVINSKFANAKNEINFKYDIGIDFDNINSNDFNVFFNKLITNQNVYSFLIALKSVEYLIERETSYNKIDFKHLPYPQTEEEQIDLQLSKVEKIWQDDVFNYYIHQAKSNRRKPNPLNIELFPNGNENSKDKKFMLEYANTFTWLMNINYTAVKEKSFKTRKITITKSYIAVEFHYCTENITPKFEYKSEEDYQNYFEKTTGNKKIARIVEFIDFENNRIHFIKPRQKRYWLKSIADRDNMSCFADFGNNLID